MIDPDFTYKIIGFIMESNTSALVSGLLFGGFLGSCITKLTFNRMDSCSNIKPIKKINCGDTVE